jgi:hypothetical protein
VHPGGIITELARHMTEDSIQQMMALTRPRTGETSAGRGFKTPPQGAATTLWAATAPAELVGGRYCEDCRVAEVEETATTSGVRPYALDPARAQAVWARSEALVGERF